jgi:SAM-dependent methyltransferase
MAHEYPHAFARFYDLIYSHMRDGVDKDYFLKEIKQTKGKVLEIGVGTGRFFVNALDAGADIYGCDVSQAMIDIVMGKLDNDQQKRISKQNITDFHYDFPFDLIIAPFRVIMHLLDKEDQLKAINNVYDHLQPNGSFIFDTFVPDLKQLLEGVDNQTDFEGEYQPGRKIKRTVSTKPELINQIINVKFKLEWDEENEVKTEYWELPLRYFFRYELEHLVERSKFVNYRIFGDYEGNELNKNSKEFIVICQK